jgi:hypothetical protein
MATVEPVTDDVCLNCGAPLSARFCAACGQARDELRRPFLGLVADAIGDMFAWDGRFLTTFRALYRRPGKVARDYVDGKRARYTPPFRMFVLISVAFFALMALAQIQVIGLEFNVSGEGEDQNILVEPDAFRFGAPDWPYISPESIAFAREWDEEEDHPVYGFIAHVTYTAMRDPDGLERSATAAAAQTILFIVVAFALLNALLHPRHRLIEHSVHALYFSAAFLPVVAITVFLKAAAGLLNLGGVAALASSIVALSCLYLSCLYLFDRGFYGSSRFGATLRVFVLFLSGPVLGVAFFALLVFLSI